MQLTLEVIETATGTYAVTRNAEGHETWQTMAEFLAFARHVLAIEAEQSAKGLGVDALRARSCRLYAASTRCDAMAYALENQTVKAAEFERYAKDSDAEASRYEGQEALALSKQVAA